MFHKCSCRKVLVSWIKKTTFDRDSKDSVYSSSLLRVHLRGRRRWDGHDWLKRPQAGEQHVRLFCANGTKSQTPVPHPLCGWKGLLVLLPKCLAELLGWSKVGFSVSRSCLVRCGPSFLTVSVIANVGPSPAYHFPLTDKTPKCRLLCFIKKKKKKCEVRQNGPLPSCREGQGKDQG